MPEPEGRGRRAHPVQPLPDEVRHSHGVLVLIRRSCAGRDQLLVNWNPGWGAYAAIGGHVEPEDAGDVEVAAARELIEEVGCEATLPDGRPILTRTLRRGADFEIGRLGCWQPDGLFHSRSAGVPTRYRFDLTWARFLLGEAVLAPLWRHPEVSPPLFRWVDLEPLTDPGRCPEVEVSDFPLPAVLACLTADPQWRDRWPAAFADG